MEESVSFETTSRSSSSTDALTEFSIFIDKLNPIISGMKEAAGTTDLPAIQKAVDSLETDYNRAIAAAESQTLQSSSPAKHVEYLVQSLGRSLGLVLFASHEAPMRNKREVEELCQEMMNVRFDFNSDHEFEFDVEAEAEAEEELEIVKEEERMRSVDDAVLHIKNGNDELFKNAILMLSGFVMDGMVSNGTATGEDVVRLLTTRMSSCKGGQERIAIIKMLRYLSVQNDLHKETMKGMEFVTALVKSLSRDVEERREAVGLLLSLCGDCGLKRQVGSIRGCIVMLVAIANDDDQESSRDARMLLNSMSGNTQHALHMAEAGYFKPLIKYLKEGSEMSKVLMATALSRLQLTDQNKASLGKDGTIQSLVEMFTNGNLESKLSALNALKNISDSNQNTKRLIESGIVVPLLQLLFSVTSVMMTLREPASAILAKVSVSESILVNQDVAHQMLSLLSLTSPVVQNHLLEALNNMVSHPSASRVREKMKEIKAIRLLLPFIVERDSQVRTGTLNLVYALSTDGDQGEIMEQLDYTDVYNIANMVSLSTLESAKEAALGILCNLPMSDKKITDILKKAELVPLIVSMMSSSPTNKSSQRLAKSIAGLLLRFTAANDKSLQHYSAENGVIPILVKLLSSSSQTAKSKAALCLAQLSQNSLHLSKKSRKWKWLCVAPSGDAFCEVHDGYCSVRGTFCLVKAGAVSPLVQILEGEQRSADEAVLSCLSTLLQEEIWESGCGLLAKTGSGGVDAVIKVLRCGSFEAQQKALWVLERVLRIEDLREEYGECALAVLIDLVQKGDELLAPAVGKVLAQLELLQEQSSYF